MSDVPEMTADRARSLVEQAQGLARAENYRGAYRALQEALAIYRRLSEAPNGSPGNGTAVPPAEFEQLQVESERYRQAWLASLPPAPPEIEKEFAELVANGGIPFEQVLAELEKICEGQE
jgi:hypothetical protein